MDVELTLLSKEEIWGTNVVKQLDVLKKYGTKSSITDLVILTGGHCGYSYNCMISDGGRLKGRTGWYYTKSCSGDGNVYIADEVGSMHSYYRHLHDGAVRPVLKSPEIFHQISKNRMKEYNGLEEVEYGEYPQYAPDRNIQNELEREFKRGTLRKTGRSYTFNFQYFQPITYDEYKYQGKKYIRIKVNSSYDTFYLSNGEKYRNGDCVWLEVTPVIWLIDDKTGTLISKRGLVSGIRFHTDEKKYNGDFLTTDMKEYLDKYMLRDLMQSFDLQNSHTTKDPEIDEVVTRIIGIIKDSCIEKEITEKLSNILEEYNYNLDRIGKMIKISSEISLETKDKNYYYVKLLGDLEKLFQKVQYFNKHSIDDAKMIQECLNILN